MRLRVMRGQEANAVLSNTIPGKQMPREFSLPLYFDTKFVSLHKGR